MSGRRRRLWGLLLFVALTTAAYVAARQKRDELVDFEVYRTAAARAITAEPLYRPDDGHYQFKYLPAFALAMRPFAYLAHEPATATWFVVCAALFVVFLRLSARLLPDRRLTPGVLIAVTFLLLGKGFVKELFFGQINLLFAVLILLALRAVVRRQPAWCGAWIALAVFVKPYAVLFVPWALVAGGPPAMLSALAGIAVGLVAPAVVYGWSGNIVLLHEWFRTVTDTIGPTLFFGESISMASMWAKWLGEGATATGAAAATGLVLLAIVAAVVWTRSRVAHPEYLEVALLLLVIPLLTPQGWDYMLLLGAPAVMCYIDRWRNLSLVQRVLGAIALAIIGFTIFDVIGRFLYTLALKTASISVAAAVLVGVVASLRWRRLA